MDEVSSNYLQVSSFRDDMKYAAWVKVQNFQTPEHLKFKFQNLQDGLFKVKMIS